jgi:hypothetical protein
LLSGAIEDLSNLNVNYGIVLSDSFAGNSLTLRLGVTPGSVPAPIPLPAALPLAAAGFGLLYAMGSRRRPRTEA